MFESLYFFILLENLKLESKNLLMLKLGGQLNNTYLLYIKYFCLLSVIAVVIIIRGNVFFQTRKPLSYSELLNNIFLSKSAYKQTRYVFNRCE
jgi:hypothetical protein